MIKDHEKFKNIFSGIQSIAITLAIIIGGIWTLYTFEILSQIEKARAELKEIKLKLEQQAVVVLDINSSQIKTDHDTGYLIKANINVKNIGNRNVDIEFNNPAFIATHVSFSSNGMQVFGERSVSNCYTSHPTMDGPKIDGTILRKGATATYPFIVKVKEPGIYHLQFKAKISETEFGVFQKLRNNLSKEPEKLFWSASDYFNVE